MPNWFFPARRARHAHVEACISTLLEEGRLSNQPLRLARAAFRLQRRAADGGVFLPFDQAFYRLKKRDREGVFAR